jgi:hypothetical protein
MRPGDRVYTRLENVERKVLLARILELPVREQLWLHHELGEIIGGPLGVESERSRQARLRNDAIEAMRVAAEFLRLPDGQAPSVNEFKRAARESVLPMTFSTAYGAFENRWELATRFYERKDIPPTAAQRSAQRAIKGRNRTNKEAPITGLRLFLTQDPSPRSTGCADYQEWAREFNENLSRGSRRVVESPDHIRKVTRASWLHCLAIARNDMTLNEAQEKTLKGLLAESGPLIGHHHASWLLGLSPDSRHAKRAGYPEPVVCLDKKNWLWRISDIRAYGKGKRRFTHEKGALQDAYMDSEEVASRLEIKISILTARRLLTKRGQTRKRAPLPTGRAGKRLYWERAAFERWLTSHPEAVGPQPRGRPRGSGGKPRARVESAPVESKRRVRPDGRRSREIRGTT